MKVNDGTVPHAVISGVLSQFTDETTLLGVVLR